MRFRPEQHLRRQGEIRGVREQGSRIDCRDFTVWWRARAPGAGAGPKPRLGVVASAAAVGGAVRRNRAKRRLREVFRRAQDLVPAGCDLLLVARAAVIARSYAELEERFAAACRRMGSPKERP